MGLRQPATKVWEIPEPRPMTLPAKQEPKQVPEPVAPQREREKEPVARP